VKHELARSTLKGVLALNRPIGQLMEFVKAMKEGPEKAELKECSATFLSLQFDLIEGITTACPKLDEDELLKESGLGTSKN
jgi:hypothetical protein